MPHELKLFNNLIRNKNVFTPINPGKIKFYSCGPTTYDFLHVGNARALVVGDLIHRICKALGYEVTFVRNFTDVDDKIIERAKELNIDPLEHSQRFIKECEDDMLSLRMMPASFTPKVSETIVEIVQMIKELVDKGNAYVVDGEVFFSVPSFPSYGKLSKKDLDSLQHGIRVEVDTKKKNPADFVLWKPSTDNGPSWPSPWGPGRPGWHIECSAMAKKFLGNEIDIHHGGIDLMFPHHENEIAQSEAANGCEFSHNWCHNEFLNFGQEKMSKSLGNVVTIRKFVEKFSGVVLRHILCSVHYRSKMEWSTDVIERSISDLERIHQFVAAMATMPTNNENSHENIHRELELIIPRMKEELANDFNVPGALSHFFQMIREVNREFIAEKKIMPFHIKKIVGEIIDFTSVATGLVHRDFAVVLDAAKNAKKSLLGNTAALSEKEINDLLEKRKAARKNKDFKTSDEIRDTLTKNGVEIKDNPDGTVSWTYK